MTIEFAEVDNFFKYTAKTDVSTTDISKDGFEVVMAGYYDSDDLQTILAKMKELQGEKV